MVRKHGWQLPAHTFQVVAITVFFLLVVAFYNFFAPFIGGHILKYVAFGIYTPVVLAVFILYVRCTAINPADPGIMDKFGGFSSRKPNDNTDLEGSYGAANMGEAVIRMSPSSVSRSSVAGNSAKAASLDHGRSKAASEASAKKKSSCCLNSGGIICALFVKEDWCRHEPMSEQPEQDALYCTLCNAEVRKYSKHCRCCDKCVDGFDHHCRWLNNCVGRKNYVTFISLMATSLIWLIMECGVGIAVLVRCFVDKRHMEEQIVDKLGNGFSRAPFIAVVIVCSVVSLLACVPLGELFFFHMILIRKGITTYEYIVAVRAMSEAPPASVDEDNLNVPLSPSGSATTGLSGGSSLGLQYKGAWCTPPRVFVDYQDEVIPHLDPAGVPSTIDPDAAGSADRGNKLQKRPVRISAWKLAKLDSNEAMRAAAKARASSSVLRPVDARRGPDADMSSFDNASSRSSMSTDLGMSKEIKKDHKLSSLGNSYPPSQTSKEDYETGTQSVSSFSSPGHLHDSVSLSPLPLEQPSGPSARSQLPRFISDQSLPLRAALPALPATNLGNQMLFQPSNAGFDDKVRQRNNLSSQVMSGQHISSVIRENRRTSVVWDQNAGRYVSVPVSARAETALSIPPRPQSHAAISRAAESSAYGRRPNASEPSNAATAPIQPAENLMYTGQSIFFGGPLLSVPPARQVQRNENDSTNVAPTLDGTVYVPRDGRGQ